MFKKEIYKEALLSQGACNASGLIHSLSKIMDDLWKEATEQGKGTDYINRHPIMRLFLEQLCFLNGGSYVESELPEFSSYHKATAICKERAGEK